jgi:hypothetical protein
LRLRVSLMGLLVLLCLFPAPGLCSLEAAVAGLVDRAADRPVDLSKFRGEMPRNGGDFRCWNGCPFVGSQNIPVVAAAAAGDFQWVAGLARWERQEGLYGSEIGSPGFYYGAVADAKMVALRDARRANRPDLASDIALALRAAWAYDSLVALETPRTSVWAELAGEGPISGPGNAETYLGLTVAVAGNRWNGRDGGDRWRVQDTHSTMLTWALDWSPRRAPEHGVLRNPRRGRGNVVAFLAGVDDYSAPVPPELFGLTSEEREILRRVVRGDVAAARTAAGWLADFGVLRKWSFTLTRTAQGVQTIFWGPWPNPNKPPHAATSVTTTGEWRTIRPSRWGRRNGQTVGGHEVHFEGDEIVASVWNTPPVRMPRLAGDLVWEVTLQGQKVTFRPEAGQEQNREHERREGRPLDNEGRIP